MSASNSQDTPPTSDPAIEIDSDDDEDTKNLKQAVLTLRGVVDHLLRNTNGVAYADKVLEGFTLLEERLAAVEAGGGGTAPGEGPRLPNVKLGPPPTFDGTRPEELPGFLMQLRTRFKLQRKDFGTEAAKVLFAGACLRGKALEWFENTQDDYLKKVRNERQPETTHVFNAFANFEEEIAKVFGIYDKRAKAETALNSLKQLKSAVDYASRFRQLAFRVHWGPDALKRRFYDGLKEDVKDELIKTDRDKRTLDEYMGDAIAIDNRQFERRQERQGKQGFTRDYQSQGGKTHKPNDKKKRQHQSTAYGTHTGPMDTSAVQKGQGSVKRDKANVVCFNCNKKGHFKRDCRAPKQGNWKPVPKNETATINEHLEVFQVAAASYGSWDVDESIDRELARQDRDGLSDGESAASGAGDAPGSQHPEDWSDHGDDTTQSDALPGDIEQYIRDNVSAEAQGALAATILRWGITLTREDRQRVEDHIRETLDTHAAGNTDPFRQRQERLEEATRLRSDGMTDGESEASEEDRPADASDSIAHLTEQKEDLKKEVQFLRESQEQLQAQADSLYNAWSQANARLDDCREEAQKLREEVFQLNDSASRGNIGWDGPHDKDVEDEVQPGEVRNPESEYEDLRRKHRFGDPEPPSWQDYWRTRAYVVSGRSNDDMNNRDYEGKFRWVEGETRRMHPEREDHARVPWFQCITNACKYHFKEKFDYNLWPMRGTLPDGTCKPVRWTFDHGQGAADYLWYIEYLEDGRLCIRPRQAWPTGCDRDATASATHCTSAECIWHLQDKALEHHQRKEEERARLTRVCRPKRRNSDSSWERRSREWLRDFQEDDDTVMEDGGDAFRNTPRAQVDYRRLNDLVQTLGNDSGPSEGPE